MQHIVITRNAPDTRKTSHNPLLVTGAIRQTTNMRDSFIDKSSIFLLHRLFKRFKGNLSKL